MTETVIKQHLIDPEICIRCNTCEAICPVGAITHDSRNSAAWGPDSEGDKLMLFFGARTQQELPYFGPLQNQPKLNNAGMQWDTVGTALKREGRLHLETY